MSLQNVFARMSVIAHLESGPLGSYLSGLAKEDVKEIKRDLKDLARSFNTLAGDGARLCAAYDELDARISTLEYKSSCEEVTYDGSPMRV